MKKIPKILAVLSISAMFFACTEWTQTPDDEVELHYNYLMLKAFFYWNERLKEFSEYKGMEVDDMYSSLNDYLGEHRYTRYYKPEISDEVLNNIENSEKDYSFGFETRVESGNDTLIVSTVYPISPAAEAGLKKRDKLLLANGISLIGKDYSYIFSLESGTVFTVLREGVELALPNMEKREVKTPTVFLDSLESIPFISVTEFTKSTNNPDGTYYEFRNYLDSIKGAKTAIINLIGNPGGNVGHCTAMAAELAQRDKELIYDIEHGYDKKRGYVIDTVHYYAKDFLGSRDGKGVNINLILLINKRSASCSERFAAAVKNSRPETIIIGETSYGKGVGQIYTKTYLGGLAYITFMKTFYGNGKTFHEIGIEPDKAVDADEKIYGAIMEAVQEFDPSAAAKRSQISIKHGIMPPKYKTREIDLGAHKRK
jgi:C-terminal processing protease CtpA/Prc